MISEVISLNECTKHSFKLYDKHGNALYSDIEQKDTLFITPTDLGSCYDKSCNNPLSKNIAYVKSINFIPYLRINKNSLCNNSVYVCMEDLFYNVFSFQNSKRLGWKIFDGMIVRCSHMFSGPTIQFKILSNGLQIMNYIDKTNKKNFLVSEIDYCFKIGRAPNELIHNSGPDYYLNIPSNINSKCVSRNHAMVYYTTLTNEWYFSHQSLKYIYDITRHCSSWLKISDSLCIPMKSGIRDSKVGIIINDKPILLEIYHNHYSKIENKIDHKIIILKNTNILKSSILSSLGKTLLYYCNPFIK